MRKERKMRGFTLVELLIVLLILGILIGLAVPRYLTALEQSRKTTFCSNVRSIVSAIETYRMNEGTQKYPDYNTLTTTIINSASYFSQAPINPYTGTVMTVTELDPTATSTSGGNGTFAYRTSTDALDYVIYTNPDCGIR
ncbi:MAG TPA: hypothetical protein DCR68_05760 [Coprothermobacter sp.]|nr:hypothetical protein [Coprothermobacter sp.]